MLPISQPPVATGSSSTSPSRASTIQQTTASPPLVPPGSPSSATTSPPQQSSPMQFMGPEQPVPLSREVRMKASSGDVAYLNSLLQSGRKTELLGVTPLHNTALHISAIFGHENFCDLLANKEPELLCWTNRDGDTPLHLAATSGYSSIVTSFIRVARDLEQAQPLEREGFTTKLLMMVGQNGGTPLHEAMRHGQEMIAKELLRECTEASKVVDNFGMSVLYLAAIKQSLEMVRLLLDVSFSSHAGPRGCNPLHPAVDSKNIDIARALMEKRPEFCTFLGGKDSNALHWAVGDNKIDMVRLIMKFDESSMYVLNRRDGWSPLHLAMKKGYIHIVSELIDHSPDAAFIVNYKHENILHIAIMYNQLEGVKYVLRMAKLSPLINQQDSDGNPPLHWAVRLCKPHILRVLLADQRVDKLLITKHNQTVWDVFYAITKSSASTEWNETFILLGEADTLGFHSVSHAKAKNAVESKVKEQIQEITRNYVSNTTIVAALIATVTFAAAFTVPGGFVNDNNDPEKGLPILFRHWALKAFLISNAVAMCSSLAVAFLCIYASLEDVNYLYLYRSTTRKLAWLAFLALNVAFATGMHAVLAPKLLWLAIVIWVFCSVLPLCTYAFTKWPILGMTYRLRKLVLERKVIRMP